MSDFYKLEAKTPGGQPLPMEQYRGKVILIANTATRCGLTPQLKGLEKLYNMFKDQGLNVIGFPCNQFAWQEPLSNKKMEEICFNKHQVTFQLTEKVNVNGRNTHPIYKFLKNAKKEFFMSLIRWNFTKFLIDQEGNVFKRYAPRVLPKTIENDIQSLLKSNT